MDYHILLKFGILVPYGSPEVTQWLKSTYLEIQDGRQTPNFQYLNRYNSAVDCLISLKFGTQFDYVTVVKLKCLTSKNEGQGHSMT